MKLSSVLCSAIEHNKPIKARVYKYVNPFDGFPKKTDLKLVEEELPAVKDGEFLSEAAYISVDPYLRKYCSNIPLGETMIGGQVGRIIESKNTSYPIGKYVFAESGWRTHTVLNEENPQTAMLWIKPYLLPDLGNLSPSLGLGVLGMPGTTAYFLFLDICKPKAGETVVVSGAAGAVGSVVGQIAKIKGLKAIGIAGSDEKGKWLTEELGFDSFINYKTQNIDEELSRLAPDGVECYFDNVGGKTSAAVLKHIKPLGRIATCGSISNYNDKSPVDFATKNKALIESKQIYVDRYSVFTKTDQWIDARTQMHQWIKDGKIKYRETVTNGFENMFEAFVDMLKGGNTGKAVVKI